MSNTNKLQFIGYIDSQKINQIMEFATLDKDAALQAMRKEAGGCVHFVDIHGNFLSINFSRTSVVSLSVIDLIDIG